MSAFDRIKAGLEQAIAYEHGRLPKLTIAQLEHYETGEIKSIRKSTGFTQAVFAQYMGASEAKSK